MKQWLLSEMITDIPRWFFLLAWLTFYLATGVGLAAEFYEHPTRPVLVNIKEGVAFVGGGLYPWLLAALYLHSEVWHMILSKRANRRAVEQAAAEAAARATAEATARAEAAARATAEATEAEWAQLREWYEQHKDQWPEGLPLPPGVERNPSDNGNGSR